jgi:hypothetical protein
MIAHVASVGEDRGRVVLRLTTSGHSSELAIEAAVKVAQAFQSEIESLFVEETQLLELASYPFAREISTSGRQIRALSPADIERDMRLLASALMRRVEVIARKAEVPVRGRSIRGEAVHVLAAACAECGPWNVVALAEPFSVYHSPALRELFDTVTGTTAIVLVGPKVRRNRGPVVAAIEDIERLPGMLRAAERLASIDQAQIQVLLIANSEERAGLMEAQVRLVLAQQSDIRIAAAVMARGAPAVAAEALRRLCGGFVIAQFGGLVVPEGEDLKPLAAALECPLFLVR